MLRWKVDQVHYLVTLRDFDDAYFFYKALLYDVEGLRDITNYVAGQLDARLHCSTHDSSRTPQARIDTLQRDSAWLLLVSLIFLAVLVYAARVLMRQIALVNERKAKNE